MEYVIGRGGLGDALLVIAKSYELKCKIFFNPVGMHDVVDSFLSAFGLSYELIEYDDKYYNLFLGAVSTVHMPDYSVQGLDYGDWYNAEKYQSRICTKLPVQELFGRQSDVIPSIFIAPVAGSDGFRHRSLPRYYYRGLVQRHLQDHWVYVIGSEEDREYYGIESHPRFRWLTFADGFESIFRIINGSERVLSVDTWVKTYACMAGIPTTVFRTRIDGGLVDPGDYIFLDTDMWGMRIVSLEEYAVANNLTKI
jgi:hypothetical protein